MAETHLQINSDGTTATRKTELWPKSENLQQEILRSLFDQHNWKASRIDNISGSHWKVETSCGNFSWKINLYISSIRDESRQPDEFKMQLGSNYPATEEPGWVNLVLGIYSIVDGTNPTEYILSGYEISRYDFSANPSIRGTRTAGLQKAKIFGMYVTEKSVLFRPEFLYYYISTQAQKSFPTNYKDSLNNKQTESTDNQYRIYITAIKTKPFLLLAGISGTGKSRIVRELARACWDDGSEEFIAQKPRNFEMIQVKPNWHDSSDLLGYVSRVSGEAIFIAGDFLKFIARAWEEPQVPYFLCLDEMNLAPVEQYFAEYLSVVESRKANSDGYITTDPILEKSKDDWYRVLTSELTDNNDVRERFLQDGICLPQNLIVVGTVNMDETTFSFSRKVLDRAMTIEMNDVDLRGGLSNRYEQIGKLNPEHLIGNAVEGVDVYEAYKGVCDKALDYLQSINDKLEGTPFKVAYRTRNEVLLYVLNNLPYNKDENGAELTQAYVIARALDEITNMKILSRIEGDESKVSRKFLEELENTIKNNLESISSEPFTKEDSDEAYKSVSLAKLDEMKKRLSSGYTSFWS